MGIRGIFSGSNRNGSISVPTNFIGRGPGERSREVSILMTPEEADRIVELSKVAGRFQADPLGTGRTTWSLNSSFGGDSLAAYAELDKMKQSFGFERNTPVTSVIEAALRVKIPDLAQNANLFSFSNSVGIPMNPDSSLNKSVTRHRQTAFH